MSVVIGIDFGEKRVGIARAETEIRIATPFGVFENDKNLLGKVLALVNESEAEVVVLGLSKDQKGGENPIAEYAGHFKEALEAEGVSVVFQDERYTSVQARRDAEKGAHVDASAAALILQGYLDTNRKENI